MKGMGVLAILLGLICFFSVTLTLALEVEGVQLPEAVSQNQVQLILNGTAVRKATFFSIRVYVMGLYLEQAASDPAAIIQSKEEKRIIMRFVRSVDAERLRAAWLEGFKNNAANYDAIFDQILLFNNAMQDVEDGDSIECVFSGNGVTVLFNDKKILDVQGREFQRALLGIWLGPKPVGEEMKRGLLAGGFSGT